MHCLSISRSRSTCGRSSYAYNRVQYKLRVEGPPQATVYVISNYVYCKYVYCTYTECTTNLLEKRETVPAEVSGRRRPALPSRRASIARIAANALVGSIAIAIERIGRRATRELRVPRARRPLAMLRLRLPLRRREGSRASSSSCRKPATASRMRGGRSCSNSRTRTRIRLTV